LAAALAESGIDTTVFTLGPLSDQYRRALRGRAVRVVDCSGHDSAVLSERYHRSALLAPPDVVHVHGFRLRTAFVNGLVRLRGHPVVYTEHAALDEEHARFRPIADAAWADLASADAITCVSSRSAEIVAAMAPADIPVGIAPHPVVPGRPEPAVRPAGAPLHIVCLSRLTAEKGVDVLVEAVASLTRRGVPIMLTVAGDGALRPELANQVDRLGIARSVELLGGYQPAQLGDVLRGAHLVVSTSHTEGLPISILEAFAHERPVVATSVGGVPELVVDGENGLLVPPNDAAAVAEAIERLAGDDKLRLRLGVNALSTYRAGGHAPADAAAAALETYAVAAGRSARANARTAPRPLSTVYRASYSRVALSTRRWRSTRSR
jgi:glycosyltransferase involved in cell wall biosynthesis